MNATLISWYSLSDKSELALILFVLPVINCLFYALSLFFLRGNSPSKRNLGWLLLVTGICMFAYFISDYCFYSPPYPILRFFDSWSGLIISPFVYLYFLSLIHPNQNHKRALLLWLSPALGLLAAYIPVNAFGAEYPEIYTFGEFLRVFFHPESILSALALLLFVFEITFFTFRIYRLTIEYQQNIKDCYSYMEKINLKWVVYIAVLFFLFGMVAIVGIITHELIYKLIFSFYSFLIMFIIYILGMKQEEVPETDNEIILQSQAKCNAADGTSVRTGLLIKRIDELFEKEQIFLDADLSTKTLAELLNTNRTYVSNAINKERNQKFYQYVNTFRIKYAVDLLEKKTADKCIHQIVSESGFKSTSTFYAFFKEYTGYAPKEYSRKKGKTPE